MTGLKIALLMDTARAYEQGIVRGMSQYSLLHGPWQFFRKMPHVSGGHTRIGLQQIKQWGAQGLLVREGPKVQDFLSLGLPIVMAPFTQPFKHQANILTHDAKIGKLGAEHLLTGGFRHFAFVGMGQDFYWSWGRRQSFCRTLERAGYRPKTLGLPMRGHLISWSGAQTCLQQWLQSLPKPIGLMACNDDICLHVIEACKGVHITIPDEVGLVGVGNDDMICTLTSPPLSSIALSTEKAGFEAAGWLEEKITRPKTKVRNFSVEPMHVVARQSSDVLMIEDLHIKKTVRYILDHAHQGLSVSDVLAQVPMSRSVLYERFREVMGHSLYEFIRQIRMERAARMLIETDLSITDIARAVGFTDQKNVARYFKQAMGQTPLQYRRSFRAK